MKHYYAHMEPNCANKPYMIKPVVHYNSDGPSSNRSSFHSSQDEDCFNCFNMDRNWERRLGIVFIVYCEPLSLVLCIILCFLF